MADKANRTYQPAQIAAPASTGNAGPQFEAKVGAFYALVLLAGSEPRGLPGATIRSVEFQQRIADHPLDDVIVKATNADGSAATLEVQVKRTLTFTASDIQFREVVGQIWESAQRGDFKTTRYEVAAAIARTTTRIEHACQEVLHWAREVPDSATFAAHMARAGFASQDMRDFLDVFRTNLGLANAPTDDETVWQLLRRFQILVFDFESPGSDYEHRVRERARWTLAPDQTSRAGELWPVLIDRVGSSTRAAGAMDRPTLVSALTTQHGYSFTEHPDVRPVYTRLAEEADHALNQINDTVGGARLSRNRLIDEAYTSLDRHRIVRIEGRPGVGKSSILKHLVRRLQTESRVIVLRNGRIINGGWMPMAHTIGWTGSQADLFNELGSGGGAILFVDNIDQIDDPAEWETVADLLSEAVRSPGWGVVVTGELGNDGWKTKLPGAARASGIANVQVETLSDEEKADLSQQNPTLAAILKPNHPAKAIAENLFYLSRIVELGADQDATIATELDLAHLWWRYGGGRSEDDRRFARLKLLRIMGSQVISNPAKTTFNVDDLDSATVAELLRLDSLSEEIKGATVAFRHDVLRDWTIGFQLHDDGDLRDRLPLRQPAPASLARALEIAAKLALACDADGTHWRALLAITEGADRHGSWKRPILLALPRSEDALALYAKLEPVLLENGGRRLREIIRLMIAIESEPLAQMIARVMPTTPIPAGASDLIVPKGASWMPLVIWLVTLVRSNALPNELIPDVVKVFQAWLTVTQHHGNWFNSEVVGILFDWLVLLEENTAPRVYRSIEEALPNLNIPHPTDVRNEIRMIAFTFAHLNPDAANDYLVSLQEDSVRYHDRQNMLRWPGTLPKAAPGPFADFVLETVIPKDDPDSFGSRRNAYGPFEIHEHIFLEAPADGGFFLTVLESSPADGLRLIRAIVEHATEWRREQYREAQTPFPHIVISFPDGEKRFEGDRIIYRSGRSAAPSPILMRALQALESWGHRQIESGRPFKDVVDDVLGPSGSSVAFVAAAADLVLSHLRLAIDSAPPMIATPELLELDEYRFKHDISGVDRLSLSGSRTVASGLDTRPSRRRKLINMIGNYTFHTDSSRLAALRAALEAARNRLQGDGENQQALARLRGTVELAIRMTEPANWEPVQLRRDDGSETTVHQFKPTPEEQQEAAEQVASANANVQRLNIRQRIQAALFGIDPVPPEFLEEALGWAKAQPFVAETATEEAEDAEEDERDNFDAEWNRRAVVMAAALVVRDWAGADRGDVLGWACPMLQAATEANDREYLGNNQIEHNTKAIAALGLVSLYLTTGDTATRDRLLDLAGHDHPAVFEALGQNLSKLGERDEKLPRTMARIAMVKAVHVYATNGIEQRREIQLRHKETVQTAIEEERRWLDGKADEPKWLDLPQWGSRRRRRSLRLPGFDQALEDDEDDTTTHYVDEQALGTLAQHLIRFAIRDIPAWLLDLVHHLMAWTDQANGFDGKNDRDSDQRPYTWNINFFDLVGILSVALAHDQVVDLFVNHILKYGDDSFHEATASFLRGYDRATIATDTGEPENPQEVRALFAQRIKQTWNYRRFQREKVFTCETHAGDALNAMFYQSSRWEQNPRPIFPTNWPGLLTTIATLTDLVVGAPTSGYIATLFLNLVDASHDKTLIPFVVQALAAWCGAYGVDRNFWAEKDIGGRICGWFDSVLAKNIGARDTLMSVADDLFRCLDMLVQSGVAQARLLEETITTSD